MDGHFSEYTEVIYRIRELQAKIEALKETLYTVKGISYNDIPKGGSVSVELVDYLIEIEELEEKLHNSIQKQKELYEKHNAEINKLDNIIYRIIIRMYYLDKANVKTIAQVIQKSISYTRKLKYDADSEFLEVIDTARIGK